MLRTLTLVAVALAIGAAPVDAQIVRGVVVEEGNSAPVEGAMVLLMELDGSVVHRVLSDPSGGFILGADHPGAYLIRVDRIGYESLTTRRFDVPVDGTFQRVSVPIKAIELTGLDVEGSGRCQLRNEQGRATARVWEEARKALAAAAWTLSSGTYRYTLLRFVRTLEPDGRSVVRERRHFMRGSGEAPYSSAPPEELARDGFIRANEDDTFTYFAPDAEAFLSDAFLDTHCMRLQGERDGMVGLDFEPIPERRVPDIRGTLWIEAATATLRRLEFRYVNRLPGQRAGEADGEVVFGQLPNGAWMVREWGLRMPTLGSRPGRSRIFLTGYQVSGGVVWRVVDQTGATVVEAASATVSGTLLDSLEAAPLGEGTVSIPDDSTRTGAVDVDQAGSFLLFGLLPGPQALEVHHPSLDTLDLGPVSYQVEAEAGEVSSIRLRLPGAGEVLRASCGGGTEEPAPGAAVFGRVRSGAGPAAGARVRLWMGQTRAELSPGVPPGAEGAEPLRWAPDPDDPSALVTTLDARGVFLLCGVPLGTRFLVEADLEGAGSGSRVVEVGRREDALVLTLALSGGG